MKYVIRYVKPHIPTMIFGFTIKFTGTILDLMIPYILSYIIDEVTPRNDIGLVIRWGLMMAVCAALVLVCNVWANRVASAVSRDSIEALRHDLFYKISYLSSSQVDAFTIPSLVTRMTTDTYNLHRTLNMIQRMGVRAPILMLGGVVVTMFIDPWLSAILCFLIPFMILAVARISRKSIPLFGKAQIAADAMIRVVRENATGIRVIKALSRTEYEKDRYETVNSRLNAAEAKAHHHGRLRSPDQSDVKHRTGCGDRGGGMACLHRSYEARGHRGLPYLFHHYLKFRHGHLPSDHHVLQGHCQRRPCGGGHDDAPGHGDPPLDWPA